MTIIKQYAAKWLALLVASAMVAGLARGEARGQETTSPQGDRSPSLSRFLLPPAILARLDLTEAQKTRIASLLQDFASKNQLAIGTLPGDLPDTIQALQRARQKEDRAAFQQLQPRLGQLMQRLSGLRDEFEPGFLDLLNQEQREKYRALKPELQRPGVLFGMAPPGPRNQSQPPPADLSALKPLTEMAQGQYHGYPGGLYPGGRNERPAAHEAAGRTLAARVQPLDPEGKPSGKGKIVLLTIGMSNTAQASAGFKEAAEQDPELNPQLVIVNGAQGGQTAARTQDPDDHASGTTFWKTVDERLRNAGATPAQVQAVWVKQADAAPSEGFPQYAQKLENELARIMQVLHQRFPNLKLVYLSSRTYGGFAKTRLNPEPYAFESGFTVKWLIERQLEGDLALNFDPAKGAVTAPWLSWGPYLWAKGATKRADGFFYEESDFSASDGTHESPSGQRKVGRQLLQFFKTDSTTRPWFVRMEVRAGNTH